MKGGGAFLTPLNGVSPAPFSMLATVILLIITAVILIAANYIRMGHSMDDIDRTMRALTEDVRAYRESIERTMTTLSERTARTQEKENAIQRRVQETTEHVRAASRRLDKLGTDRS